MSYLIQNSVEMVHGDIRALEAYWQDLRAGRACPFRAEVDPRDIRSRIGNLFILEDLGLGNVRFRIAGTALVDAFGMELRGMPVRTMMELRARQSLAELLAETLAEPGVGYARLRRSSGRQELWEIILLPLRSDQGRIDRVLGALHCLEPGEPVETEPGGLRFFIDEMSITPVEVRKSPAPEDAAFAGFAEDAAPYHVASVLAEDPRAHLRAIDGGRVGPALVRDEAPQTEPERRRPALRIVSGDD